MSKTLKQFLEARMIATGDFRISASGRKVRRLIKVGDDDYNKEKDIDKDGDIDADDEKKLKESLEQLDDVTWYDGSDMLGEAQDRYSSSYQFTHKPGDEDSEKKLADLKKSVKGTGKRVVLQGRLGKNNPNAHKYSKNAPQGTFANGKRTNSDVSGKSGAHTHQRIQKADAAHHDVYVYDKADTHYDADTVIAEKLSVGGGPIRRVTTATGGNIITNTPAKKPVSSLQKLRDKTKPIQEGRSDAVIQTTAADADENARHIFNLRDHGIYAQQGAGASHHVLVPKEHEDRAREILSGHLKEGTVPAHMKGTQKPYVSSDGKGNYEVLGNTGQTKAEFSRKEHGKDAQKKAQAHLRSKYDEYMKEGTDPTPVAPAPYIHRVAVTVSDPDSTATSKRDEKVQKMIRVTHPTDDKAAAVERAKKHYKKFGWKVHGAEHTGMVHEETINEYSMDDVRKDAADRLKKTIDKQSDDRIAALKNPPKKKGFFARVGEKQINMVKGAYHGLTKEETELEEAKDDKTDARFIQLARLGLVEQNDLANLRLAMKTLSEDKQLTIRQRNLLLSVYESLISIVTGDDTIFSRMKIKVQQESFQDLDEDSENGLAAKAKKSGVSLSVLKKVYARGVAAWNSGHRPGTTPQQWGYARVNSYITKGKGTYGGADKDLREGGEPSEFNVNDIDEACWDTHKQVGMKKKGDKMVPDCVPKGVTEDARMDKTAYHKGMSDNMKAARVAHWKKMDKKSDSDPSAYEPAPGDATAKTKPSVHTKKYHDMYGESKDVPFDGPYTKTPETTKDKSGAVHTPQSRVRHLARLAMKKQADKSKE